MFQLCFPVLQRTASIRCFSCVFLCDREPLVSGVSAVFSCVTEDRYPPPGDSNPAAVGLIIGVVGGVFTLIIIFLCVGICCFRKYRARGGGSTQVPWKKTPIEYDEERNSVSMGHTNESMNGSPFAKKKLLSHSDSNGEEKADHNRVRMPNLRNSNSIDLNGNGNNSRGGLNGRGTNFAAPPPPPPYAPAPNFYLSGQSGGSSDENRSGLQERGIDVDTSSRNDMFSALRKNPKFRNSFKQNEKEAEDRAKRISSSSSFDQMGLAPAPPISKPSLPPVPKSPKGRKSKTAGINKFQRSTSLTEEEVAKLENGEAKRKNNSRHQDSSTSSSEVVAITSKSEEKPKQDTRHGLKPDRTGKSKKKTKSTSALDDELPKPSPRIPRDREMSTDSEFERPERRGPIDRVMAQDRDLDLPFEKMGSGRYSKGKGRKSPRPGKGSGMMLNILTKTTLALYI